MIHICQLFYFNISVRSVKHLLAKSVYSTSYQPLISYQTGEQAKRLLMFGLPAGQLADTSAEVPRATLVLGDCWRGKDLMWGSQMSGRSWRNGTGLGP